MARIDPRTNQEDLGWVEPDVSGLLRYARNDVSRLVRFWRRGRRLKGLDEFETPSFVGRMARVERRRKLTWYAMVAIAVGFGVALGLLIF